MTARPRNWNWPDGQSSNTPSSASSFGFDVAAELSRMNHPTARAVRADLLSRVLPTAEEVEVGASSPRRGPVPMPSSAVGLGAPPNQRRLVGGRCIETDRAGVRRGLIALALCFVVGFVVGRRR